MSISKDTSLSGEKLDPSTVTVPLVPEPWTVEKALNALSLETTLETIDSPIAFFHLLEALKRRKRQGWVRHGIKQGESIADHSFRMAMMSMVAPSLNLDQNRCVKMCLVHDLGETLVGDITPADGVPKAEKERREKLAINHITELLKPLSINVAKEIQELWGEFEHCETPESQFVQDIDKLELLSQMIEYEKRGKINLQEFTYVKTKIRLPDTQRWAEQLLDEREKFWAGKEVPIGIGIGEDTKSEQDQYYSNK